SVTGEKHLAVAVTLLVVQICVVLGVFVVLHWIRTRPRGMNFVLWRPWVVIHVGGVIDLVVVCVCGGYHVNINTEKRFINNYFSVVGNKGQIKDGSDRKR
ncbi:hypothetical protein MAR_021026, partial [Mya arenaria]